jgi:hypothetical protein
MKQIKVGHNKIDSRSRYVYLGSATAKAVEMQPTETNLRLLDIVFEVPLEEQEPCEFLIRVETSSMEVLAFLEKLRYAIDHPLPHPWENDLFDKAVTGKTFREVMSSVLHRDLNKR